jgi:hypothetical protein
MECDTKWSLKVTGISPLFYFIFCHFATLPLCHFLKKWRQKKDKSGVKKRKKVVVIF